MKKIVLAVVLWLFIQDALGVTPFIITDIRVEGVERLEAGTIFNYLPLKVGDELNDEEARLSIKELFATGFFKDVALEHDGSVLVVKVVERPSISELTITGNRALGLDALNQGLEQAGLVQGRIFNSASLGLVEHEIKNAYLSLGRYSASVESKVEPQDRNRVAITLKINEGRVATIKKVNIIGAKAVSTRTLIKEMTLRDKRGLRLFSKRNQYSKQKLEADIEAIRSYYLDRGFHDFTVISSNVDISPNKQNIFINISIDEGSVYTFGDTVYEVAIDTDVVDLDRLIAIQSGAPFSRKVVSASRTAITNEYADKGYAFVNVRPLYETDRDAKTVKTVFAIDPKQRVYVRKVEITGNLHTRDQVIRRELRQFEGAWYSASAVKRSRARLRRLGYFDSVTIDTPAVPGTTDQVDVKVAVQERNTGAITFSVGYSDADGALIGAAYSQRNLLGTGRELNFNLNSSDASKTAEIAYVNPFHTAAGVSRGLSFTSRRVDTEDVSSAAYVANTTAAAVNYKIPIAETNALNFGVNLEQIELETTGATPFSFEEVIKEEPKGTNLVFSLGVSKDARNDFFFPTEGTRASVSLDIAVPGSEYAYYKLNLHGTYYKPLSERLTAKANINIGYGDGRDIVDSEKADSEKADKGLPFFRHYFAGGTSSVRGYKGRALGPVSASPPSAIGEPLGGDQRLLVNFELLFPPFGADTSHDKRVGFFLDGGMVYGQEEKKAPGTSTDQILVVKAKSFGTGLRYTAGLLFHWVSPVGPFSISYAVPLNDEANDRLEEFQISLGTVFR